MSITSEVFNIDCIEGMKKYPNKYFEAQEKMYNNFISQTRLF